MFVAYYNYFFERRSHHSQTYKYVGFIVCRFLTQKHIKTVVTVGCPVTDRKVVNASKRLRVMCEVSEDEVHLKTIYLENLYLKRK